MGEQQRQPNQQTGRQQPDQNQRNRDDQQDWTGQQQMQGSQRPSSDAIQRDEGLGLDMQRNDELTNVERDGMDRDLMQGRPTEESEETEGGTRREQMFSDEGRGRGYDRDDMEAQGTSELDEEGYGQSRERLESDQQRNRQIDR